MPILAMAEPAVDHQRRFQAAVDVIHNLPKNGSYRPSYEVMLRFYSLYKQAVCGQCMVPRPGFWDPVGRYKWDAWSQLGEMSRESAMAAYVEEMKKVAQEVIHTMPMDETTAPFFHHFEPLYRVIDDMPLPPASLFNLIKGPKGSQQVDSSTYMKIEGEEQETSQESLESSDPAMELNMPDDEHLPPTNNVPKGTAGLELDVKGLTWKLAWREDSSELVKVGREQRMGSVRVPLGEAGKGSDWRPCLQCTAAASQQEETWWPFDVSCQTVVLFMLWPFVTQGLVYLLRKAHQRSRTSS
ncbi:hypothetical protein GOODEAATRI_025961 [Goodea atripinnis]|uniref:ACB domain-containing protein n=1 Tax=Goodea atripinnis TaxID=208336 RepID=A0ABV0PSE3_9TELE